MSKIYFDFPDGWSCCDCGKEYATDYIGEYVKATDNFGVYCNKCGGLNDE